MLDILIDYQIFSLQQYGGISRYFSEIAWRINKFEACRTTLFCPLYINSYLKNNYRRYSINGLYIHPIPRTGTLRRLVNKGINRLYGSVKHFDIVHKTYFWDRFPKGNKTIVTVYDMINELFPEFFSRKSRLSSIKSRAIEEADGIISISHNTKKDLLNFFDIDPDKIFVTQLGFSTLPVSSFECHASSFPKNYILFVGKRGGHKNFDRMIRGFSNSRRLRDDFHVVCFGDRPFSESEKSLFLSSGLKQGRIHHIAGDDGLLAIAYQGAAALVYPSLYEGFGIPLLEAMSCGCPVVCSNTGSLPEVAGNSAELFDPYHIDAIQSAMENVLYSTDRTSDLIKKGAEQYKHFSWERCARETMEVYLSI